jgi:hypothetical protein
LTNDIVPRNASGVATTIEGSIGTSALKWLKAHIASGYWDVGDIKPHHTYNGVAAVGQGWYPCDGTIINEANYNSVHGAGSWDTYVVASVLDGKYAPDMTGKYLVGSSSTTETGTSGINSVGASGNQLNLAHAHSHNHIWYAHDTNTITGDYTYNSSGVQTDLEGVLVSKTAAAGNDVQTLQPIITNNATINNVLGTSYTNLDATSNLSSTQSIQPSSIEVIYYIRII